MNSTRLKFKKELVPSSMLATFVKPFTTPCVFPRRRFCFYYSFFVFAHIQI